MERVRVGEAALLMYAAATYVPQSIFHALNEEALTERFRIDPGMQPLALFIVAFLLLALQANGEGHLHSIDLPREVGREYEIGRASCRERVLYRV